VVGDQGGLESDYRLGIDGRTPVVVENNQSDTSCRCHPRLTRQPSAAGPRQPWAGCSTELVTEKLLQKEEGGPASAGETRGTALISPDWRRKEAFTTPSAARPGVFAVQPAAWRNCPQRHFLSGPPSGLWETG